MVVYVIKRNAVCEAKIRWYAVRKAKIGRYAVRKGEGCHPHILRVYFEIFTKRPRKSPGRGPSSWNVWNFNALLI